MTWRRLGPREKHLLAVLRRADGSRTVRQVHEAVERDGATVGYTTIATVLDRLAVKGLLSREAEVTDAARRYRYVFEPTDHADGFVADVVDDVALVLGDEGLDRLAERASARRGSPRREAVHP